MLDLIWQTARALKRKRERTRDQGRYWDSVFEGDEQIDLEPLEQQQMLEQFNREQHVNAAREHEALKDPEKRKLKEDLQRMLPGVGNIQVGGRRS